MTWEQLTDPTFVTNLITSILTLVLGAVAVKQRADMIIAKFKVKQKDQTIEEQAALIQEQNYEMKMVSHSMGTLVDILNMIAQASKLSTVDKTTILEKATANKQYIQKMVEDKEARIAELLKKGKNVVDNSGEIVDVFTSIGETVLDRYAKETVEQ